jgi:D-alanyl-lipoteichoic acid acyltransferase DltB (MBOAT superfamily)
MVFNSIIYILFLSIVVLAFYIFPSRIRWIWLLIASVGYYLSFIPIFILLLGGLTVINYFLAKWLAKIPEEKNRVLFIVAIIVNLLVLSFFKYFNILFPGNQIHLYSVSLFVGNEPINKMILPLGLSYFTFTLLSYLIEIKRKNILPERHFGYFSLYLFFFPKIAQGPIERPQQLIPQLHQNRAFNYTMLVEGLKLMLWGYFKKLVVADRLAIYVNAIYDNSEKHNGTTLLVATIFYAFQIYADFSGYTDIARGSAKLFGFDLMDNFKRPYFARSIKEFWNRWHITFSTWLRDYIFLPLAYYLSGRMKKTSYLFISTENWIYLIVSIITFGICGIWHGVGWNYLFWGVLFGIYLTYSNWAKGFHKNLRKLLHVKKTSPYLLFYKMLTTFMLVLLGWVFFRAPTLTEATKIIGKIFTSAGAVFYHSPYDLIYSIIGILFLIILDFKREFFNNRLSILYSRYQGVRIAGIITIIIIILLIGVFDGGQFIYFQY